VLRVRLQPVETDAREPPNRRSQRARANADGRVRLDPQRQRLRPSSTQALNGDRRGTAVSEGGSSASRIRIARPPGATPAAHCPTDEVTGGRVHTRSTPVCELRCSAGVQKQCRPRSRRPSSRHPDRCEGLQDRDFHQRIGRRLAETAIAVRGAGPGGAMPRVGARHVAGLDCRRCQQIEKQLHGGGPNTFDSRQGTWSPAFRCARHSVRSPTCRRRRHRSMPPSVRPAAVRTSAGRIEKRERRSRFLPGEPERPLLRAVEPKSRSGTGLAAR